MDPYHRKEAKIEVPADAPTTTVEQSSKMEDIMQLGRFGDGRLMKMEVDYSAKVDEQIAKADQLAKVKFLSSYELLKIE